jgi:hypothetical protein
VTPTYVYGLVHADTALPPDLVGLGPSGRVGTVVHGRIAAIVSDVPSDRPLGTGADLRAHEAVVDTVAAKATVLPVRFPAVIEEDAVVSELLAPNHDHFAAVIEQLDGCVQFSLKGRYEQDVVLREVLQDDPEIRELRDRVRELPEDAAHFDRIRLGELVVGALEERRDREADDVLVPLRPLAVDVVENTPAAAEDVVDAAFLVERSRQAEFEEAVEQVGRQVHPRIRLRLLGPLAPYDFVPEE